jgi:XTP/dITP diphosphohydrolase
MAAGCAAITHKLIIATHNPGKLAEFRALLAGLGAEIISASELGLPEPEEISDTFAGNAQLKARAAAQAAGLPALADDSGLCVAALGGAPGIFSARYAAGDYPTAFQKIIAAADETGERRARFICALCLAQPDGTTATYIGQADGKIAATPAGAAGFGYDAIFIPDNHTQTYAELGHAVKDQISHRALALEQFLTAYSPN